MASDLVEQLQAELDNLLSRLPRHSTPPAMLERLDELEAALAEAKARAAESAGSDGHDRH